MSQKNWFNIGKFQHITIKPYWFLHFTIRAKNIDSPLHHLENEKDHCTISPHNHIDTFQSPYHINTSPYHEFTISPRCYKCESTRYNKKRSDKIKISKYNSNVPINPYKNSSRDEKKIKQIIIFQKRRHQLSEFFRVPNEVKESIDLTDGGSIKSIISYIFVFSSGHRAQITCSL